MSYGPVDLVVLGFPGNQFKGDIIPEIQKAVDAGVIRIIDILLAVRVGDEPLRVLEITEVEDEALKRFEPMVAEVTGLLNEQDVYALGADMPADSSVAMLLFENTWAAPIADAMEAANGVLLMHERIPRAAVEMLVAEAQAAG